MNDELTRLRAELASRDTRIKMMETAGIALAREVLDLQAERVAVPDPTDDQVEALARVLRDAHWAHYGCNKPTDAVHEFYGACARAAFAFFGAPVDPDLWKTDFKHIDKDGDEINIKHGMRIDAMHLSTRQRGVWITPADASELAAWLTSYVQAHA